MESLKKPNYSLWPYNPKAIKIDADYFRNLPRVEYIPGHKEYVRMYFWGNGFEAMTNGNNIITLMTDHFKTEEEAWHFARAFEKHNCGIVEVEDNIVYGKTHVFSVIDNYIANKNTYFEFANWA